MKIPKSFMMGPHYWRVHYVTAAEMEKRAGDDVTEGYTDFQACEILIIRNGKARTYLEHIFCHELMHVLAQTAGMTRLGSDEGKIDALGGLLLQAFNTMK